MARTARDDFRNVFTLDAVIEPSVDDDALLEPPPLVLAFFGIVHTDLLLIALKTLIESNVGDFGRKNNTCSLVYIYTAGLIVVPRWQDIESVVYRVQYFSRV